MLEHDDKDDLNDGDDDDMVMTTTAIKPTCVSKT